MGKWKEVKAVITSKVISTRLIFTSESDSWLAIFWFLFFYVAFIIAKIISGTKWEMKKFFFLSSFLSHSFLHPLFALFDATCLITYAEFFSLEMRKNGRLKRNHEMKAYLISPVFYYMSKKQTLKPLLDENIEIKS